MARWSEVARAGGLFAVLLLGMVLPAPAPVAGQQASEAISGGGGTFYSGAYADRIHVVDEETLALVDTIQTQNGIPGRLVVSENRERIYVTDATYEYVEVIDLATRESIDSFTLSDGARRFWMRGGFSVDPQENYALIVGFSRIKHADRYEVHSNVIIRYDLKKHEVMDTIPWPDGHVRSRVNFMFSPDGSLAYFSAEDMIVLETENFTEVDRWAISEESEPGLGVVRPSFGFSYYEEPGFFTGLVRMTDPHQPSADDGHRSGRPGRAGDEVPCPWARQTAQEVRVGAWGEEGMGSLQRGGKLRILGHRSGGGPGHASPALPWTSPHGPHGEFERKVPLHPCRRQHHRRLRFRNLRAPEDRRCGWRHEGDGLPSRGLTVRRRVSWRVART